MASAGSAWAIDLDEPLPIAVLPPPPHDARKRSEALELSRRAGARAIARDYPAAIELYSTAIDRWWESEREILPAFSIALAVCFERAGRPLDALAYVHAFLRDEDADRTKIAQAKSMLPRLMAATGHIIVDGRNPRLANMHVDGRPIYSFDMRRDEGGTTFVVDVTPGGHEVTGAPIVWESVDGHAVEPYAAVTVRAGEEATASFRDRPTSVPAAPVVDALEAMPDRDARVAVDFAVRAFRRGTEILVRSRASEGAR